MAWAAQFVAHYGYAAIFALLTLGIVGPLIPDETILVFAGILIRKQALHPAGALAAAYLGSVCGITLSYILGRTLGLTAARWLRPQAAHLQRAHDWFACYGGWTLFFGYFVVGVRHFTALVAGTAKLEARVFAAYAYSGGLLWVVTFLSIGFFIGDSWERWARYIHGGFLIAAVTVVAVGYLVYRRHRRA